MQRQDETMSAKLVFELFRPALPRLGESKPIHVRLHSNCGACGVLFETGEKITALKHHENALIKIDAREFPPPQARSFPVSRDSPSPHGRYQFCRLGNCAACGVSSESITCHSDCFNLWMKSMGNGHGSRKLWFAATWRYPWLNCPELRLPPGDHVMTYMDCAKEALAWPDIAKLPAELKTQIVELSGPTKIGRIASVLQLVSEVAEDRPFVATLPLDNIKYWCRGGQPTVSHASNGEQVQLTIDARGLMEICWVTEPMKNRTARSDRMLYISGPIEQFSNVEVAFQNGLARLMLPCTQEIKLWDSPAGLRRGTIISGDEPSHPPHLTYKLPISRFTSLDLGGCDGLTFFIVPDGVHSIHAHTPESPNAIKAFERLRRDYEGCVTWFYLPLAAHDEVLAIGLRLRRFAHRDRMNPTFVIHLRSGHYVIGPHREGAVFDVLLQTHGRPVLAYEPWSNIQVVPHINQIAVSPQTGVKAQYRFIIPEGLCSLDQSCLASAPLTDVESMDVFRSAANGPCVGIIFTYRDGWTRSVGQCRLDLDIVTTYKEPVKLYHAFRSFTSLLEWRRGVLGEVFVDVATVEHPEVALVYPDDAVRRPTHFWAHSEMQGVLHYWSKGEGSYFRIETPEEIAPQQMIEFNPGFIEGKREVRKLAAEHLDGLDSDAQGRVLNVV